MKKLLLGILFAGFVSGLLFSYGFGAIRISFLDIAVFLTFVSSVLLSKKYKVQLRFLGKCPPY